MTVGAKYNAIKQQLQSLPQSRLEADRLMAHALQVSPSELIRMEDEELEPKMAEWLTEAVARRLEGEPLAYILETQGFYKYDFVVRKGVLIPRPETEFVVETALRLFPKEAPKTFADLGCGSGCIGLSLLKEWPSSDLLSVDASETAIEVTKENMMRLSLNHRCRTKLSAVQHLSYLEEFDLIVANPPYIAPDDRQVEENVKKYEPHEALFAEQNGFAAIFQWSTWAMTALKPRGWWVTEIGAGQMEAVRAKLIELGFTNLGLKKDLAGHIRVMCAQKP